MGKITWTLPFIVLLELPIEDARCSIHTHLWKLPIIKWCHYSYLSSFTRGCKTTMWSIHSHSPPSPGCAASKTSRSKVFKSGWCLAKWTVSPRIFSGGGTFSWGLLIFKQGDPTITGHVSNKKWGWSNFIAIQPTEWGMMSNLLVQATVQRPSSSTAKVKLDFVWQEIGFVQLKLGFSQLTCGIFSAERSDWLVNQPSSGSQASKMSTNFLFLASSSTKNGSSEEEFYHLPSLTIVKPWYIPLIFGGY